MASRIVSPDRRLACDGSTHSIYKLRSRGSSFATTSPNSTETQICTTELSQKLKQIGEKSDSELKADIEEKHKRIDHIFETRRLAEKVGLCFLVDCTGSMRRWINDVKKNIKTWSEQLHDNHINLELHVAFVRYTDYDQPERTRTTYLDFTTDLKSFFDFVDAISAPDGTGGDAAEDVFGGLDAALKLNWAVAKTKVLIHITDAPCHGQQYHGSEISDMYPNEDPEGLKLDDLMRRLINEEISYFFAYIEKTDTQKMIKAFNASLYSLNNHFPSIKIFNLKETRCLIDGIFKSVTDSISATVDTLMSGQRQLKEYTINEEIPDWNELSFQEVMVIPLPSVGLPMKLELPHQPMRVKIAPQPFAEGAQKIAYHALTEKKEHIVLKQSKWNDARSNCIKRCLETAQTHAISVNFAATFNSDKPLDVDTMEIQFIRVSVMQVTGEDKKYHYFTYEPYLKAGSYSKFTGNFNCIPEHEDHVLNTTCQAFSHYTWVKSDKELVICDLQGMKFRSKLVLTDPAIHYCNNVLYHGSTNLGPKGIEQFFQLHKCNEVCTEMQLERPDVQS